MSIEMDVFGAMNIVRMNAAGATVEALPVIQVRTDPPQPTSKQILTELRAVQSALIEIAKAMDAQR
jgi:hypothetical protein